MTSRVGRISRSSSRYVTVAAILMLAYSFFFFYVSIFSPVNYS
jgi:hypothetical protein